ncbi:MAG TPA: hypothetical protein VLC46_01550 [Thermoanaerobaculia bacterium]|jgi:hypothetical protein|nr:hypothetical protein [Thermoanaerobaculia bacterium]
MSHDLPRARAYVASLDLSGTPRGIVSMDAAADTGVVFDEAKAQAQVVGSGVFAFAQGVANDVREAISDSALLAQLVANKRTSAERDPLQWFAAYSEVLQNVGWTLQAAEWTDYTSEGTAAEVHEKISTSSHRGRSLSRSRLAGTQNAARDRAQIGAALRWNRSCCRMAFAPQSLFAPS